MSWISLLKADKPPISVGALISRFRTGKLPSKEEIAEVTNQDLQDKYLDNVITKLREGFNSSKEGNDLEDSVVTQMITGRRTKVADTREESLKIIEERLKHYEGLKRTSDISLASEIGFVEGFNELEGKKTPFGKTYGDIVSPDGKTNQEWTIETLNTLYNMMVNEPSVDVLYALHKFIDESTNGQFKGNTKWYNKMGINSIENPNPEFFQNVFKLRLEPEVTGGVDKRVFDFFTNKYKYTSQGMKDITVVSGKDEDKYGRASERVRREGTKERTRRVADPKTMEVGEATSEKLLTHERLGNKIAGLTEGQFKELVEKLQKTNSAEGIFKNIRNQSIGIVYDLGYKGQSIVQLVRDLEIRRKGDRGTQRQRDYLHDWTISYINRRMDESNTDINIGGYEILSRFQLEEKVKNKEGELVPAIPKGSRKYESHYTQRAKLIDWIKSQVKNENATWKKRYEDDIRRKNKMDAEFRKLPKEEQDEITSNRQSMKEYFNFRGNTGADFVDLAYSFDTEKGLSDFIDMLETPMNRFERNILALMYNSYIDLGLEGKDTALQIVPTGGFKQYLPTGKLFADPSEENFIKSMRALMTIIKMTLDRDKYSPFNVTMRTLIDTFFDNIEEYFKENDSTESQEDRLNSMREFIEDGDFEDNSTNWFATRQDFREAKGLIDEILIDVEDAIKAQLASTIQNIADDTTGRYRSQGLKVRGQAAGIREYLITKKFLRETSTEEEE
tara:strand:+ start:10106 stop:12298 length:2193 start_codon:yes stop_codon:yes gene_type:complete